MPPNVLLNWDPTVLSIKKVISRCLAQLTHVFFTSKTWRRLGGLPGLCLTVRACGAPDLTAHAPQKGVQRLFHSVRHFVRLDDFDIKEGDCQHEDNTIEVQVILTKGEVLQEDSPIGKGWNVEENARPEHFAASYVVTIKGKAGKLRMDKCQELKVPKGPILGKLKAGEDVILEDGRVIKSEDVTEAKSPNEHCFIVDCPTLSHLKSLSSKKLAFERVPFVFHFTPKAVMISEEYQQWAMSLGDQNVRHVALNELCVGFPSQDVLAYNEKLSRIMPGLFPNLHATSEAETDMKWSQLLVTPISGSKFSLRPTQTCDDRSNIQTFNKESVDQEVEEAREVLIGPVQVEDYPKVTFTGTGSSVPSKYRCVTGILVETEPFSYILLDCGEGTLGQLQRHFGVKYEEMLRHLKAIFVSHLHADHHMGLINILLARQGLKCLERLLIVAPVNIKHYLSYYHANFEPVLTKVDLVANEALILPELRRDTNQNAKMKSIEAMESVLKSEVLHHCKLSSLDTCKAIHCPASFSMSLITLEGFKLAFSGDTRPNEDFVVLGKGSNLLIHEGTMGHDLLEDAKLKKHSTFKEAVEVAQKMESKEVILTHFSQRYSKVCQLSEFRHIENVCVAFDHMTVSPKTLEQVRRAYPALEFVFKTEMEEMEAKKVKMKDGDEFQDAKRKKYL